MENVLIISPYGEKVVSQEELDKEGNTSWKSIEVNFDEQYNEIKKFVESKGNYKVHRVDNTVGIDIYKKMYRLIHSADIVIADITGLNPNVMYELGARHALKDKKTIMISKNTRNIPFDINVFHVFHLNDMKDQWDRIMENNEVDSPIKKNITGKIADDIKAFDGYESIYQKMTIEYEKHRKLDSWEKCLQVLNKYKSHMANNEQFIQNLALSTYKNGRESLSSLSSAKKILGKINPSTSHDYETMGLACSITRKIAELTKNEKTIFNAFDYSRRFISVHSVHKAAYSFSSYILSLVLLVEAKICNINFFKEEMKLIRLMFNRYADFSADEEWHMQTDYIIKISLGEKNSKIPNNMKETDWNAVRRIKEILKGGEHE